MLILANKQDLPGAREPKHIEKLLGLHELLPIGPVPVHPNISANCASSASSAGTDKNAKSQHHQQQHQHHSSTGDPSTVSSGNHTATSAASHPNNTSSSTLSSSSSATISTSTSMAAGSSSSGGGNNSTSLAVSSSSQAQPMKGWYIQPACAITGEGLQEGLEALYDMIIRKRKLNKTHRKKR